MPQSMTGFATAAIVVAPVQLTWELRSVNHRFLDLGIRLPEELRQLEPQLRELLGTSISRGKVDCTLKIQPIAGAPDKSELDPAVLAALKKTQERLRAAFPDAAPLSIGELLRWPGLLREPQQDVADLAEPAKACFVTAAEALGRARAREGERIAALLEQRCAAIVELLENVRPRLGEAQALHREKLAERLNRLDVVLQAERLEQELALIVQRLDVAEEIDRIESHVGEIRTVLSRSQPIGRRLDFLIQELNREANTFASKVQDEELTRYAVDLKVLIEQMREQVQNLE